MMNGRSANGDQTGAPQPVDTSGTDPVRERVSRLFRFVAALYEQRNPAPRRTDEHAWQLRFEAIPEHAAITLQRLVDPIPDDDAAMQTEAPPLLTCRRPVMSEPPVPPEVLASWLGDAWNDCRAKPQPTPDMIEKTTDGETIVVAFDDASERTTALVGYRSLWDRWAASERITLDAGALFEKLYGLHGMLERDGEQYELVVADGLLSWDRSGISVRHPLLARTVRLEFNPQLPEFRIVDGDRETEFYTPLFRGMSDVDGTTIARLSDELAAQSLHPLAGTGVDGFLAAVAATLSPKGRFVRDEAPGPERADPVIGRQPVFFLRKRTAGFARAIDSVVADLAKGGAIPRALMNIVGAVPSEADVESASADNGDAAGRGLEVSDDEILFTKQTNREQLDIAQCLERDDCVLVQGPPGTGKTHTIANLLGHLLAQGKSVLVVSHTTKALKVVREKVVEELRPLCVSVLDTKEDDAALKASVEGIVERIGNADLARLDREIASLSTDRSRLLVEVKELRAAILEARLDEQREIVLDGTGIRPIDAAKEVAAGTAVHDWIPSPVLLGAALPLSHADVARLYATNASVRAEDERTLVAALPERSTVPAPTVFASLCAERLDLAAVDREYRSELWNAPASSPADVLEAPRAAAHEAVERLRSLPPWTARLVDAGSTGAERAIWDSLFAEIASVRETVVSVQSLILTNAPRISEQLTVERAAEVYAAIAHDVGATGKAPGFLTLLTRPDWKIALESATVGAQAKPRLPEHFAALAAKAEVDRRRNALLRRWAGQVEAIGGPAGSTLGEDCEVAAQRLVSQMTAALEWRTRTWAPVEGRLASIGLAWSHLKDAIDAARPELDEAQRIAAVVEDGLNAIVASEHARRRWEAVNDALLALRTAAAEWPASDVTSLLRDAIDRHDPASYASAHAEIERLRVATEAVRERAALLASLETVAPQWATAIRVRDGAHGRALVPGDIAAAWRRRQFEDELNRRERISLPDLLGRLDHANCLLLEKTTDLVDRRAWRAQVNRTTLPQRQALMGFAEAKRRIGRGTGKRAAQFARLARERMVDARSAVPVWIMPVVKAAEVFDPAHRFDVVIIDEASQSDVTGLIALYLGTQIVVVGDDEQVSPSAVGERAEDAQHLIDEMLYDIPDRQLYDGKLSLYDIAKKSFSRTVCLLEHFRCVPEIIQFSNALSYDGKIRPLREPGPDRFIPAVVEHRVAGGASERKRNETEARTVACLVAAAMQQPEYRGKTFGIVSLVGDEQAYRIEEIIRALIPPTEIAARRLLAGSASHFQGDERNVMFLSVVDSGEGVPLPMRDTRAFQQRFNVAASRAQDQMWVVHSLDHALELKPNDLRRRLIEHARDPSAAERMRDAAIRKSESAFETEVLRRLANAGFAIESQYAVGAYRIDIVVGLHSGPRLAVECDGERFHTLENLREDTERQAILERLGWRFERIRGSRFYRDPEAAMATVFARLAQMGIRANLDDGAPVPQNAQGLVERVRARAQELIAELDERLANAQTGARRSWRGVRRQHLQIQDRDTVSE